MEVVLIFRQLSASEKIDVTEKIRSGISVLSLPGLFLDLAGKIDIIPEMTIREATKSLIEVIKELGDKEFIGKSLSSHFDTGKIPLWYYQRFRIFFLLRNEWIINECLEAYSKNFSKLTVYLPRTIANTEPEKNSGIEYIYNGVNQQSNTSKSKRKNYRAMLNYIIFFFLRVVISLFRKNDLKRKRLAVVDRSSRQLCRNINTLEKKWDNYNLYPLFDSKPEGLLIISEVETPKINSTVPFPLHNYYFSGEGRKRGTLYGEWILFRGLFSFSIRKQQKEILKAFDQAVVNIGTELKQIAAVKDSISINRKQQRVFEIFQSLRNSTKFYIFKFLSYKNFFESNSFKTITSIDENSPATRCILDAARSCSVKTIGIQHGNIGDSQPAYLYTIKDREKKVMADMTIVWGEYFRDFLINNANFPADSVKLAGQMRSDLIPALSVMTTSFRKQFSDSKRIVTFASQPIADENYRHQIAYSVFSCFKNHPEVKLIVKLHPAERHAVPYYENIAREAGYPDPDIRYEVDLYELLSVSDIVITGYSTVGSETVYFGKSLIIYDPFKEDLLSYVKEGVAFMASNQESLSGLVEGLLTGKITHDQVKYDQFIKKYAFAIDGKATSRTINYIMGAS